MGIEGYESENDLQPALEEEPFFKGLAHCESWIDRALLDIEIEGKYPKVDPKLLAKAKEDLEYAKSLLQAGIELPEQRDVDTRFYFLVGVIMENEEVWGELGEIYAKVSNFISMEMTKD